MAKNKKSENKELRKLWADIDIEHDFIDALDSVDEVDIGDYNTEKMVIFSANVNYARQLLKLSDSLKPVYRRILYMMYVQKLMSGGKQKSITVVGSVTTLHPHGGTSVYATTIGLGQYWKTSVPLIKIIGSFGTEVSKVYAADRYTELTMTKYAEKCFFEDFDPDCVQMIANTSGNRPEPVSLPSRYPNILVNGGMGFAVGNAFRIPPYNINDIIRETKNRLKGSTGHVYLVPDLPTGCDIVDKDDNLKKICEFGKGNLTMRAKIEVVDEGKHWALHITNLPWGVYLESILESIAKLIKEGVLPIKEVQDRHEQIVMEDGKTVVSHVDSWAIIDKAHDPYAVRDKLFKKTQLQFDVAIDFKVVLEELTLERFSLGDLITAWIENRREYKRRLINKRITKLTARIETLKVLIDILDEHNLEETVRIIRQSEKSKIVKNLVDKYGMTTFQAERVADIQLRYLNKDAPEEFAKELKQKEDELERAFKMVKSEKEIDEIIMAELDELKEWATPRRSQVIYGDTGENIDTSSEYFLVVTKKGNIKKISASAVERSRKGFGVFETGDYPTGVLRGKNLDSILFVDSFGKFSLVQMSAIGTVAINEPPMRAYDSIRLEGEIISMVFFQNTVSLKWLAESDYGNMYIVMVSKNGIVKKIPAETLVELTDDGCKTIRNSRITRLKSGDSLAHADYYLGSTNTLIYTKKGEFTYITTDMIPEFGRDAVGNEMIKLSDGDECVGCCAVGPKSKFVIVVTAKGRVKKCEVEYLGKPSKNKGTSYLATVPDGDEIIYCDCPEKSITICTKMTHYDIGIDEIKTMGRKASPPPKIKLEHGDVIIQVIGK